MSDEINLEDLRGKLLEYESGIKKSDKRLRRGGLYRGEVLHCIIRQGHSNEEAKEIFEQLETKGIIESYQLEPKEGYESVAWLIK